MKKTICLAALAALFFISGSFKSAPKNLVKIHTGYGDIVVYLYDATPKHRDNFIKLTKEHYYDSTTFHRVIKNFVIQGGDPNSKDNNPNNDGMGGPSYRIDAEINPLIKHKYGALGAARDGNPQKASNGSQFYIVVSKQGLASLDGNYTVFGEVVSGMDIAEKIAAVPTDGANNRPLKDIKMSTSIYKKKADLKQLQIK